MKNKKSKEKKNGWKKFIEKSSDGFTFVETLAVLAIGAILTAGTAVSATKIISTARKTAARNQLEQYYAALQSYFLDCGCFPTTEQGLQSLWEKPVLYPVPERWNGPYVERKPTADPWGTNFEYISASSSTMPSEIPKNLPFVLISYGADCKKGGEGDNADIVSWE